MNPNPSFNTFLYQFWERFLHGLGRLSLFQLFNRLPFNNVFLADIWVLLNLAIAVMGLWIGHQYLLVYGAIRVLEIVVYHTNVMFFEHYRHHKTQRQFQSRPWSAACR